MTQSVLLPVGGFPLWKTKTFFIPTTWPQLGDVIRLSLPVAFQYPDLATRFDRLLLGYLASLRLKSFVPTWQVPWIESCEVDVRDEGGGQGAGEDLPLEVLNHELFVSGVEPEARGEPREAWLVVHAYEPGDEEEGFCVFLELKITPPQLGAGGLSYTSPRSMSSTGKAQKATAEKNEGVGGWVVGVMRRGGKAGFIAEVAATRR
ncbi:hypothetical protein BHM03_00062565 [Ensete ventricosum]|nr:hypothetical protein BHM03_00062565 [Ensete ventricosum]